MASNLFDPALQRSVEDGPRFGDVVALETDAAQVARRAVDAIAAHHVPGFNLVAAAVALDLGQNALGMGFQPDQPRRTVHLAALFVEVVGENGLGDLLGHA
jgi:hypothetical protein